ncbi:unnamed protein product [Colias eurytheme]|nr:unnamed protein product [Colias eurytheme]
MKYFPSGGQKETYTLLTARRRYMKKLMRQHVAAPWSSTATGGARAQHELFELLERVQCSRLDDQRAVLPPYFSQRPSSPVKQFYGGFSTTGVLGSTVTFLPLP